MHKYYLHRFSLFFFFIFSFFAFTVSPFSHSPILPSFHLLCHASDEPFLGPANWGGTGLMEIPTARVIKENTFRLGAAEVYPYRYYYGALGILPGLEIDGRVTEIVGVKAFETTSYRWYKR